MAGTFVALEAAALPRYVSKNHGVHRGHRSPRDGTLQVDSDPDGSSVRPRRRREARAQGVDVRAAASGGRNDPEAFAERRHEVTERAEADLIARVRDRRALVEQTRRV